MSYFEEIYRVVKLIPKGKVATYGQIADLVKSRDARKVGWALHANKSPFVPCHRVVNKDGGLAKNFSFGPGEQKRRLLSEGVEFNRNDTVRLDMHLWEGLN